MKHEQAAEDLQTVHFITDWWDGPKSGFADFAGGIHSFERIFDEGKEEWSSLYRVRPVSDEEYSLQVEAYHLFLEWKKDEHQSRPHPLLDPENRRFHEIEQALPAYDSSYYAEPYIGEFVPAAREDEDDGEGKGIAFLH
ncbi:hypothetical protein [Gorillibacterium sp. CAU 1737]|uniref:hypothetical protein n=1 Tax=Gorillibacterium sp. CAU 1737 TaxID=3140362 RepID=UPI00325FF387